MRNLIIVLTLLFVMAFVASAAWSATEIKGTVTLSDWTPADSDKQLTPVKIELIPQGSGTAQTQVVVLDASNGYDITCDPGTYDVAFTAAGWLKKVAPGIVVSSGSQAICNPVLARGDVNGNNHIDTADSDIVRRNFDRAGYGFNPPVERGKQWIRSHPFTVGALVANSGTMPHWSFSVYKACNFTASFPWNFDGHLPWNGGSLTLQETQFLSNMDSNGMPWHIRLNRTTLPSPPVNLNNTGTTVDKDNGWYITDEPDPSYFPGIAQIAAWLKQNRPNSLVYFNICCHTDSYVDDAINIVKPDVLMVDEYLTYQSGEYPPGGANPTLFTEIANYRNKCQQYNLPMMCWTQSFSMLESGQQSWRLPSESEMRAQIFFQLAAGAKGIAYFLYDHIYPDTMFPEVIMQADGTASPFYSLAQTVNTQINYLGRVLRYLNSGDLRFIPGSGHTTPSMMSNWALGAGGDSHITACSIAGTGTHKDGVIGFFTDDLGQRYFMLTNLYRGPSMTASTASASLTLTFDTNTNGLWRLNRDTGAQEWVTLTNHVLTTTLPGGTGDLYTYAPGGFDLAAPQGTVSINSGAASTTSTAVTLTLSATDDKGVVKMRFSNDKLTWSPWEGYETSKQWDIPAGGGTKIVYVQYEDAVGTISAMCSDSIVLGS